MTINWFSGIVFAGGIFWNEQRRFTVRHLRDLGFGKSILEDQIIEEINSLIQHMKSCAQSNREGIVDFKSLFMVSVINIIWSVVAGTRYQRNDPQLKQLCANLECFLHSGSLSRALLPIPTFMLKLFPGLKKFAYNTDLFKPLHSFIQVSHAQHLLNKSQKKIPISWIQYKLWIIFFMTLGEDRWTPNDSQ